VAMNARGGHLVAAQPTLAHINRYLVRARQYNQVEASPVVITASRS
jgi:hypothetical protein